MTSAGVCDLVEFYNKYSTNDKCNYLPNYLPMYVSEIVIKKIFKDKYIIGNDNDNDNDKDSNININIKYLDKYHCITKIYIRYENNDYYFIIDSSNLNDIIIYNIKKSFRKSYKVYKNNIYKSPRYIDLEEYLSKYHYDVEVYNL